MEFLVFFYDWSSDMKKEFEIYTEKDIVHLKSVKSDVFLELVSIWMAIFGSFNHVL